MGNQEPGGQAGESYSISCKQSTPAGTNPTSDQIGEHRQKTAAQQDFCACYQEGITEDFEQQCQRVKWSGGVKRKEIPICNLSIGDSLRSLKYDTLIAVQAGVVMEPVQA